MEHWYVYYKVPAGQTGAVAQRVRAMFNVLRDAVPNPRLLQRAEPGKSEVTLMEVYEPVADAALFAEALARAVKASGLAPAFVAARRIERFEDL